MLKYTSMNTIFTICSNNYLAQAKTLGDSVLKYHPNHNFTIVLCDKLSQEIDYSAFTNFNIIEAHNIGIDNFEYMTKNYNIVELNTAIKPFVFDFLFKSNDIVIYLDPDTCLFDSLEDIENDLKNHNAVLTPHIFSPIAIDGMQPTENTFTNYGIYNLGFFAAKNTSETKKLINWWQENLKTNCKIDVSNGIFVDQLPMNFAPIFFDEIKVNKNPCINVAPWNLHERKIDFQNGHFRVNDKKLVMFHFSNYNPLDEERFTKYYTRAEHLKSDALCKLYETYKTSLLNNGWEKLKDCKCFYIKPSKQRTKKKFKSFIPKFLRK